MFYFVHSGASLELWRVEAEVTVGFVILFFWLLLFSLLPWRNKDEYNIWEAVTEP